MPAVIGIPREIKPQEHRVALLPAGVKALVARGHRVLVQRGAGVGAGYSNTEYQAAGAELRDDPESVFADADLVTKVKEPQPSEIGLLRPGQILFTYLHLAADREQTAALIESGVTAIAYETVRVAGHLPLLEPMSEIAGRMASLVGAVHLGKHHGGRGILLGGVPGVLPGRVVVIGGGTAGTNAARVATGMGADVTILEVDFERMRFLDVTMGSVHTLYSNEANLADMLPRVDVLIGAVLLPGARAPKLVTRDLLQQMPAGSVFVDVAVDQGGCAETTRPTTHAEPTFVEEDVLHYCVANMPGAYPRTASQALANATFPYLLALAVGGLSGACRRHPELIGGVNIHAGRVTCQAVAEAHQLEPRAFEPEPEPGH